MKSKIIVKEISPRHYHVSENRNGVISTLASVYVMDGEVRLCFFGWYGIGLEAAKVYRKAVLAAVTKAQELEGEG